MFILLISVDCDIYKLQINIRTLIFRPNHNIIISNILEMRLVLVPKKKAVLLNVFFSFGPP